MQLSIQVNQTPVAQLGRFAIPKDGTSVHRWVDTVEVWPAPDEPAESTGLYPGATPLAQARG